MRPSSLVAVVTANVWTKTELLLQTLTANRDAFEVLVSVGARQTLLRLGWKLQLPSVSHDMARLEAGLQAPGAASLDHVQSAACWRLRLRVIAGDR